MEYAHRMWGRAIGLTFVLPALFFWRRGQLTSVTKKRVAVISGLIGFQVSTQREVFESKD
jgi:cytochrome c oxidase assembly protein subunit 15